MGWIFQQTGSTGSVALLMLVRLAPPILGGGAAAALVDGVRKERLLVCRRAAAGRRARERAGRHARGLMPVVYVAIAFSGLLGAISPVAVSALIPSLVPRAELPAANGLAGVIDSTAMATGALAGGALLALVGRRPRAGGRPLTFVLAALLFAGISAGAGAGAAAAEAVARTTRRRRGCATCSRDRTIVTAVGALCITVVAGGLVNATLPRYLADLGPRRRVRTASASARSRSAWRSAARSPARSASSEPAPAVLGRTLFATAVLFCALAAVTHAPVALLLLVLVGVLDAIGWVMFDTVMQRSADPRLLGRAFGITDATVRTAMIGSIALAPLANELADPDAILLVGAASCAWPAWSPRGATPSPAAGGPRLGRAAGLVPAVQPPSALRSG